MVRDHPPWSMPGVMPSPNRGWIWIIIIRMRLSLIRINKRSFRVARGISSKKTKSEHSAFSNLKKYRPSKYLTGFPRAVNLSHPPGCSTTARKEEYFCHSQCNKSMLNGSLTVSWFNIRRSYCRKLWPVTRQAASRLIAKNTIKTLLSTYNNHNLN